MGLFDPNAYGNPMRKAALKQETASHPDTDIPTARADENLKRSLQNGTADACEDINTKTSGSELTTPKQPVTRLASQYSSPLSGGLAQSKYASAPDRAIAPSRDLASTLEKKLATVTFTPKDKKHITDNIDERCHHRIYCPETRFPGSINGSGRLDSPTPLRPTTSRPAQLTSNCGKHRQEGTNGVAVSTLRSTEAETPVEFKMPTSSRRSSQTQPIIPHNGNDGTQMSPEEKLVQAREKSLRKIQSRNRTKDPENTTSLRDLDIARKSTSNKVRKNPLQNPRHHFTPSLISYTSSQAERVPAAPKTLITTAQAPHSWAGTSITHSHNEPVDSKPERAHGRHKDRSSSKATEENSVSGATIPLDLTDIAVEMDKKSDAGGSSIRSNASEASGDSVRPLYDGKIFHKEVPRAPNSLVDWEGKMLPPPPDWHSRSRYDSENPEFYDDFARWNNDVVNLHMGLAGGPMCKIPHAYLQDLRLHPDGIWLLMRDAVVDPKLAAHYEYPEPDEVTKYVQPLKSEDFEDWGKLDLSRPENRPIKDETTESLVTNWIQNTEERRKLIASQVVQDQQVPKVLHESKTSPNPNRPTLNIYLRPACGADVSQIADIYNWYVMNSPRTAEISPVSESDIRSRLDDAISNKLPLIVAVENNKRAVVPFDTEAEAHIMSDDLHSTKSIDQTEKVMRSKEKIVGWASAQDFTAADFVERISVELEIFVDPAYRQMGIGRCLMDQLLEACDRGYLKRGGYHFHCPQTMRHLYNSGGGRDLHKMMVVLRKWKYPKKASGKLAVQNGTKKPVKKHVDDQEDEYEVWLRKWLESWGFEVEGVLKGVGVKNGRFLDMVHLGRETRWQPAEGRIPEPLTII